MGKINSRHELKPDLSGITKPKTVTKTKASTKKKTDKKTTKEVNNHTSSHASKPIDKSNLHLKHKREQALLDLVAPRLIVHKQIEIPLTKVTINPKVPLPAKFVYGELYTLFNITPRLQLNHASLAKPVGITTKQVTGALKYLARLKLIKFIPVRPVQSRHILGYAVSNTGLNASANQLDNVLQDTDYRRNVKLKHQKQEARMIIKYLNHKVHRSFRYGNANINRIVHIFRAGYHLKDFYIVIDKMYKYWNNRKMYQYLVPKTLFRSIDRFDEYLNKPIYISAADRNYAENKEENLKGYDF